MQSNHSPFALSASAASRGGSISDRRFCNQHRRNRRINPCPHRIRIRIVRSGSSHLLISQLPASLNMPFPSWSSLPQGPMVPPSRLFVRVGPSSAGPLWWADLAGVFWIAASPRGSFWDGRTAAQLLSIMSTGAAVPAGPGLV